MKGLIFVVMFLTGVVITNAQSRFPPLDKSPMDMSYYPVDYPILKIQDKANEPLVARVIYGRPQKNGRVIFGDLVPYGSVWRMGANEATEIEFFRDVKIDGKKVAKGRYTLYAIPDTAKWTVILNKETDIWGAFKYDPKKDLLRVDVPIQQRTDTMELFSLVFERNSSNSMNLLASWDNVSIKLPIEW